MEATTLANLHLPNEISHWKCQTLKYEQVLVFTLHLDQSVIEINIWRWEQTAARSLATKRRALCAGKDTRNTACKFSGAQALPCCKKGHFNNVPACRQTEFASSFDTSSHAKSPHLRPTPFYLSGGAFFFKFVWLAQCSFEATGKQLSTYLKSKCDRANFASWWCLMDQQTWQHLSAWSKGILMDT